MKRLRWLGNEGATLGGRRAGPLYSLRPGPVRDGVSAMATYSRQPRRALDPPGRPSPDAPAVVAVVQALPVVKDALLGAGAGDPTCALRRASRPRARTGASSPYEDLSASAERARLPCGGPRRRASSAGTATASAPTVRRDRSLATAASGGVSAAGAREHERRTTPAAALVSGRAWWPPHDDGGWDRELGGATDRSTVYSGADGAVGTPDVVSRGATAPGMRA